MVRIMDTLFTAANKEHVDAVFWDFVVGVAIRDKR